MTQVYDLVRIDDPDKQGDFLMVREDMVADFKAGKTKPTKPEKPTEEVK